jgi:hypothetical protein
VPRGPGPLARSRWPGLRTSRLPARARRPARRPGGIRCPARAGRPRRAGRSRMQRGDNAELITRLIAQLVDSSDLAELTQCQLFRAVSSDPARTFRPRADSTFLSRCDACGAVWELRRCASCRRGYPVLNSKGTEPAADDRNGAVLDGDGIDRGSGSGADHWLISRETGVPRSASAQGEISGQGHGLNRPVAPRTHQDKAPGFLTWSFSHFRDLRVSYGLVQSPLGPPPASKSLRHHRGGEPARRFRLSHAQADPGPVRRRGRGVVQAGAQARPEAPVRMPPRTIPVSHVPACRSSRRWAAVAIVGRGCGDHPARTS